MNTARTFNGLSTQIFLWFWFMLLVVVAAVVILPTLDPRNIIPLPAHEMVRMNNNLKALQRGADPNQDFDLAKAIEAAGLSPVDNIYLRDEKGQMQSSTRLSKFVVRFMVDSDNPAKPMLGSEHQRAIAGPFEMEHHGQTYHVYFGLNVENSYLFLFIQILDHPIQILGIAMLVSTPLCLLLAWRLTRPILQLQRSVSQLAEGNLEVQIPNLGRRDEIGQLADHVSHMVDTLKSMIQKQKQLLSDISHELRSPLTRIQLAQALIRRKQGDSNELARIESEIGRLDKLIGDLLDLSRVQQHVEAPVVMPLAELLEPMLDDAMFEANQSGKQLRLPPLPTESIRMWPELLARALENPLRNALKYAHKFIKLDWYREGREWVITIRDDGPGVPVAQQEQLFLPFFRVDDARNAKTGGTGLGLAIASEAIQRHGGTIRASCNQPTGLTITIRLPIG
ncbi:TPA: HAMP domain-containing protein [Aeromonas salmonicida]|uniref:ATP-binding protein n=1 Tax=Aeromonas salmonicida TaxID=645 RepID=UPI0004539936|nr:ATP-binding protein [Aeromonas salmonicida]ELI6406782.1 HAMP domain-containing protein [Aeromonas salmonicida subsp. salmonicida]ASI21720.1 two-component sensor histidine kinase [Aeromonas salmonicida]ASI26036.1 two-component sensor histidine kinase [Aeromonas salmonicida]ASI30154.1 two-component sensor histidine kinase [Aeromonas salmonicida]ATD37121.1 histidine kinase [Aeromonas salmonicida subsp. masoucida]